MNHLRPSFSLCNVSLVKSDEQRAQRKRPEFFQHFIDLYHQQNGRCSISGVPMKHVAEKADPYQISISWIDKQQGSCPVTFAWCVTIFRTPLETVVWMPSTTLPSRFVWLPNIEVPLQEGKTPCDPPPPKDKPIVHRPIQPPHYHSTRHH